jgi:hypothetical protein
MKMNRLMGWIKNGFNKFSNQNFVRQTFPPKQQCLVLDKTFIFFGGNYMHGLSVVAGPEKVSGPGCRARVLNPSGPTSTQEARKRALAPPDLFPQKSIAKILIQNNGASHHNRTLDPKNCKNRYHECPLPCYRRWATRQNGHRNLEGGIWHWLSSLVLCIGHKTMATHDDQAR